MALYHVFDQVTNRRTGVPMMGVRVRVKYDDTDTEAPIYADQNGELFEPDNTCLTDADGMFSFYVNPGEYKLEFLVGSDIIKTIADFRPAEVGPAGPANSTYATTAELESADTANVSAILAETGKAGTFTTREYADFTAQVAADTSKVNYIRSVFNPTKVWVRTSILTAGAAQVGTAAGVTVEAELSAKANALGIAATDTHLGPFTGGLIPANKNAKEALQVLSDAVQNTSGNAATKVNATAVGVDATDANMGTTPGTILSDNGTAKDWFEESEAAIEDRVKTADLASADSGKGASLIKNTQGRSLEELTRYRLIDASEPNQSRFFDDIQVDNPTTLAGPMLGFKYYNRTGVLTGQFDSGPNLISRHKDIRGGGVYWHRWEVMQSPLAPGSGFTGQPGGTQQFAMLMGEFNAVNRHGSIPAEWDETRAVNPVSGYKFVPEASDFGGELSPIPVHVRVGYDNLFGWAVTAAPLTCSVNQRQPKVHFPFIAGPNSTSKNGACFLAFGHRTFATACTIVAAGSGYTVGDQLTTSKGASATPGLTLPATLRVRTVNGSGAITELEVFGAGGWVDGIPTGETLTLTGGTGTGATAQLTLSVDADERPKALFAFGGKADYGIDFASDILFDTPELFAGFAPIRLPNNQAVVAQNAAGSGNIALIKARSDDLVELDGKIIVPWTNFSPTLSTGSGALGGSSAVTAARYSRINDTVHAVVTVFVDTVGTGGGAIRVTLPISTTKGFAGSAFSVGGVTLGLAAIGNAGASGRVEIVKVDGTSAIVAGTYYTVSFSYEVA